MDSLVAPRRALLAVSRPSRGACLCSNDPVCVCGATGRGVLAAGTTFTGVAALGPETGEASGALVAGPFGSATILASCPISPGNSAGSESTLRPTDLASSAACALGYTN